jgi:hypothetical protein
MDPIERYSHVIESLVEADRTARADLMRIVEGSSDHQTSVERSLVLFPEFRLGQAHMNVLRVQRPDLYDEVTGTSADCFYLDERVPAFLAWLADRASQ